MSPQILVRTQTQIQTPRTHAPRSPALLHALAYSESPQASQHGELDVTLSMAALDVQLGNPNGASISFSTRAYNGSIPGPVLRVKPGDIVRLTLANDLPKGLVRGIPCTPDECTEIYGSSYSHPDETNLR